MKSTKVMVSLLSVVVCGLFAFSFGLQAQPSGNQRISRATPIRDVAKFESTFTERLNQAISAEPAAKRSWIAGKKVFKGFVDYYLIKTNKSVAQKDLVQLSNDDLKALGDLVKHRFDEAISMKKTSSLGAGQITQDFFTGKLLKSDAQNVKK